MKKEDLLILVILVVIVLIIVRIMVKPPKIVPTPEVLGQPFYPAYDFQPKRWEY